MLYWSVIELNQKYFETSVKPEPQSKLDFFFMVTVKSFS